MHFCTVIWNINILSHGISKLAYGIYQPADIRNDCRGTGIPFGVF